MACKKLVLAITLVFSIIYPSCQAQTDLWPFKDENGIVRRGNITGTVGDYRAWGSSVRFHSGVDFTSYYDAANFKDKSRSVYSMHAGRVVAIIGGTCLGSYIEIELTNGQHVYYKHIAPSSIDFVTGATVTPIALNTQVQVGSFLGLMIPSGCEQHVHINNNTHDLTLSSLSLRGLDNYIYNFVHPFHDTHAPDFMYPFDANGNIVSDVDANNAVEFRANGHLFGASNHTRNLNETAAINAITHKIIYDKIDIISRIRDRKIFSSGGEFLPPNGSPEGNNGINKASYQLFSLSGDAVTSEIENINFNTIPLLERAVYVYDDRSQIAVESRHVYILTNNASAAGNIGDPCDRFFNTRLRINQTEDWNLTNRGDKDARCIFETQYPDGPYKLRVQAGDIADQSGTLSNITNRDASVLIDNFRPIIKEIVVKKNNAIGNLIYHGYWTWNATTSQLTVTKTPFNDANPTDKIWIQITTSEPVQNLQTNIPWADIGTYRTADVVPNTDNKVFTITYNPITTSGSNPVNIRATDYAGNELQTNPAVIPIHQADGTWVPVASPGSDSNHQFKSGLGVCSAAPTGRRATSAVASSTMGTSSSCLYADVSASAANVELNDAVVYTPVTSGSGLLTYSWDFGAGALPATSTSAGAQTVVYSTTGAKTVTLKICDNTAQCITQTKTNIITVGQAQSSTLSVDFDADRYGANTDQTINLTSIVSGAVGTVTYSWDFGDEVTKGYFSDVNPSIAYKRPGHKTIRLTVTDANGSVTKVRNDYFLITSFLSDLSVKITGCGNTDPSGTINGLGGFVDGGNGGPYNSYSWDFGDGSAPGTGTIVSHRYTKSGTYTVSLTVCDDAVGCATGQQPGCVIAPSSVGTSSSTPTFLINNLPVSGSVQQVGLNSPVKFVCDNTGIGGVTVNSVDYTWKFDMQLGNINSTTATPNFAETSGPQAQEVVYSTLGDKVVMLTTANGAVLRTSPFQSVLTVVSGKGKGTCFANIGDITLSATCWKESNKPKFTVPVTTKNCPVAKTEVMLNGYLLPGGVIDFTNFYPQDIPKFPFTADFKFTVYQYDGRNYNVTGYKVQRFTIYGPVPADAGADKKVCLGSSVQIGSAPLDAKLYKWSSTTAPLSMLSSTTIANPTFNGVQKGTFTYTVTVDDQVSGCSATDQITITVDQPVVNNGSFYTKMAVATPLTVTTSGGFGGNTYAWSPADNLSSTSIVNPVFTSPAEGDFNYLVNVTDQQGCSGSGQIYVNAFSAPGNLQATSKAYSWVALSWVDRTTNESSFTIRRSVNDALSFVDYASVSADATTFNDFNVQKDVTYYYQVVANIAGAASKSSNVASVNSADLSAFTKILTPGYILTQGDYDSDGQIEFAIQNTASIDIYKYLPTNQFSLWKSIPIYAYRAATGDFDNDGDLDIYIGPYNAASKLIINSGGSFSILDKSPSAQQIGMIDYDSDNDIDLMLDSYTDKTPVQVFKNIGSNQFTEDLLNKTMSYYVGTYTNGNFLSSGDWDNDGDPDVVSGIVYGLARYKNNNTIFDGGKSIRPSGFTICTDLGDFDNDGWLDITAAVFDGVNDAENVSLNRIYKNNKDDTFSMYALTGIEFGEGTIVQWGDFDSDGDLDLMSSGYQCNNCTSLPAFEIYRNNNNQFVLEQSGKDLLDHWLDIDSDGDLDLVGGKGFVYLNSRGNNQGKMNVRPTPPSNLCVFFKDNKATFSWDPGSDSETPSAGLSYNLYVKQNGRFILSPLADLTTGFRKIGKRGNVDGNTSWTLTVPNGASLEWGVQAIDNSFQGSTFATNTITTALPFCGAITTSRTASAPQGLYTPQNCSPNATVVSNGATLTLTAGTNISLLPGFSVRPGSFLNARLTNYTPANSPCYHIGSRENEITAVTETLKGEDEIFIYPNPNNGQFNIEANFPTSESLSIEVITISGLRIRNKQYEDVLSVNDVIDISDASQGLYIVRFVLKNGKVVNKKIVKL